MRKNSHQNSSKEVIKKTAYQKVGRLDISPPPPPPRSGRIFSRNVRPNIPRNRTYKTISTFHFETKEIEKNYRELWI